MDMNERVEKLEVLAEKTSDRLYALEQDVAIIKASGATRSDIAELRAELRINIAKLRSEMLSAIAKAKTSTILWVVGAIFLEQVLPMLLNRLGV
jgi:cell division septum initiation protein DivIVA